MTTTTCPLTGSVLVVSSVRVTTTIPPLSSVCPSVAVRVMTSATHEQKHGNRIHPDQFLPSRRKRNCSRVSNRLTSSSDPCGSSDGQGDNLHPLTLPSHRPTLRIHLGHGGGDVLSDDPDDRGRGDRPGSLSRGGGGRLSGGRGRDCGWVIRGRRCLRLRSRRTTTSRALRLRLRSRRGRSRLHGRSRGCTDHVRYRR